MGGNVRKGFVDIGDDFDAEHGVEPFGVEIGGAGGRKVGMIFRAASSARKVPPRAARSATIGGRNAGAIAASMSSTSVAPHTLVRRILALAMIARAMESAAAAWT